eukprot:gnl/Hemi2/27928_TR9220_c0_g1_i1.p1 gnl/Hemi2/27928_TR9220_c0_g1~~gnl/Hemi2/27928_TR9220_c0_g1_i1.p1  ORF type:complete len:375 (-),score=101.05 gnl/Hemi2/27928_TR9220_c0_g1_i1:374-1498(-)
MAMMVWAKMKGFPWWPARLVATPPGQKEAPPAFSWVLFFGTGQYGKVETKSICDYQANHDKHSKATQKGLKVAIVESDAYLSANGATPYVEGSAPPAEASSSPSKKRAHESDDEQKQSEDESQKNLPPKKKRKKVEEAAKQEKQEREAAAAAAAEDVEGVEKAETPKPANGRKRKAESDDEISPPKEKKPRKPRTPKTPKAESDGEAEPSSTTPKEKPPRKPRTPKAKDADDDADDTPKAKPRKRPAAKPKASKAADSDGVEPDTHSRDAEVAAPALKPTLSQPRAVRAVVLTKLSPDTKETDIRLFLVECGNIRSVSFSPNKPGVCLVKFGSPAEAAKAAGHSGDLLKGMKVHVSWPNCYIITKTSGDLRILV